MRETRTALPEVVRFKAPAGFMAALTEASARNCSNASEFVRRATLEKLREMGVLLPGSRHRGHPVPPLQPGNSLWPSTYKDLRR